MTSTFVNDLRLNEQETGDNSGSWGTVTNTNLTLIGEALGYGAQQVFGSDANATTTVADGAADPARAMYFKVTSAGNLTATRTMTIAPNTVSRLMFIENATSGSQSIAVSQGSGANVTIPAGDVKVIYTDGAGSGGAVVDAFASLSVVDLNVSGAVDIDGAVQIDNTLTVGVDDTGYDVKFFGATASAFMQWDASADDLILGGAAGLSVNSAALVTGVLTTTATTVFNGGFTATADSTITIDDNGVALELISTDTDASQGPVLRLSRAVAGAADDIIGTIQYYGQDVAGNNQQYVELQSEIVDATEGSEDSSFIIKTYAAGDIGDKLSILPTEVVLNNGSRDIDFRVESDNHTDALFVDAGDDKTYFGKSSSALSAAGIEAHPTGRFMATLDGGLVAQFNRLSNDGSILEFYKDGSAVGSVGSVGGGDIFVGTGDVGVRFDDGADVITPWNTSTNSARNSAIDLGHGTAKFKDLYLSGGVYLGGTGAANKLDDYEEGTWTPAYSDAASGGNTGVANGGKRGTYTKVGNLVTITASCSNLDTSGMTAGNDLFIQGVPFLCIALAGTPTTFWLGATRMGHVTYEGYVSAMISDGVQYVRFSETRSNGAVDQIIVSNLLSESADLHFTMTYETSA